MTKMRIAFASPWNVESAIAQSASEVAFELAARGHAVTVLRTEVGQALGKAVRPAPGPVRSIANFENAELRSSFDIILAQLGNYYSFHGAVLPKLGAVPMVGVFHDVCYSDLMHEWVRNDADLRKMVYETYSGTPAAEIPPRWNDSTYAAKNHPMLEWFANRTVGAVGHAEHYADRLRSACPGPVAVIPLAFDVGELPPPPMSWKKICIAVIGHANLNKRIDQLILAIGASHMLRTRCVVRVIGPASSHMRERLTNLAVHVGVEPPEFTGWVPDERLRLLLRDVDVISCLRNPIFEGASASLILGLLSGRPVLVANHGCYADVPPDAALFCEPGREALDILFHLERLAGDPEQGRLTGALGRRFATTRHSASAYVDALEPLIQASIHARPGLLAKQDLTNTLAEFGIARHDKSVSRIATVVDDLSLQSI